MALVKFGADGVKAFVDLAGEVKEFRRVAGGSAEDASKLVAAFKSVGVDASTAATGVFQLEKHLAAGADKLAAFGVTAQKDSKGNTDMSATLLNVGDAYKRIQDPVQRAALLTAAFGRQGTALIPLLGKSRAEIEQFFDAAAKHHEILTDADLKKATDFKLAMHDLGEAFKGIEVESGKALTPLLTDIARAIDGAIQLGDRLAHALHIPPASSGFSGPGGWIDSLLHSKEAAAAAAPPVKSLSNALTEMDNIAAGFKTRTDEAAAGIDNLDKALTTAVGADHALADAHRSTIDAQAALNKLQKEGAVDAEKVADAQRSLAAATRSVGHAQREAADAQAAYDQAAAAANILGTDTAQAKKHVAANALADANDNVASSLEAQKKAAADLATAKAGDPDYQNKLADAKQRVADATLAESQRALASVTAHTAEADALKANSDQVQTLIDKYAALVKQHPEVALALAGNIAALNGASPPPPTLAPYAYGLVPVPPPAMVPDPNWSGAGASNMIPAPTNVTNNVTITNTQPVDPLHQARQMIWALN